jgi:hypothetical protein
MDTSSPPQLPQHRGQQDTEQRKNRHAHVHGAVAWLVQHVEGFHHALVTDDENENRKQNSKDRLHSNLAVLIGLLQGS